MKEATMNEQPMIEATDPVCGMTVDISKAVAAGLMTEHEGQDLLLLRKRLPARVPG